MAAVAVAVVTEMCSICLENYKGVRMGKVTCQYCPTHACRPCQQRYLLQTFTDPHCVDCKRGWSSEFMADNFPLSFRKDALRKWRRRVLMEREKATLPAMQVYVEYKREAARLKNEVGRLRALLGNEYVAVPGEEETVSGRYRTLKGVYDTCLKHYADLRTEVVRLKGLTTPTAEHIAQLDMARKNRAQIKKRIDHISPEYNAALIQFSKMSRSLRETLALAYEYEARYDGRWVDRGGAAGGTAVPATKREFIMKCPDGDCRGFLSTAYKCGTCEKHTCPDCMEVLGLEKKPGHTCDKEAVESTKAIKAETRPCPKCGTRIFKIDGCDQMYCVMDGCNTAFSWNTGQIETGRVHNPHYYEWLRRTGGGQAPREAGDIPCGGLPGYRPLYDAMRELHRALPNDSMNSLYEIHRYLTELIEYRLRDFPARAPALANKEHHVAYLMKQIDEAEWCRQLEFTEAKAARKRDIGQIIQMAATAASDIYNQMINEINRIVEESGPMVAAAWVQETVPAELERLRLFVNDSLVALAKRERMAVPQFGEGWRWQPCRALYKAVTPKGSGATAVAATASAAGGGGPVEEGDTEDMYYDLTRD